MSFDYLASPYTDPDPAVREERYQAALRATAKLMEQGRVVFSPIAHSHNVDRYISPEFHNGKAHAFWMAQCSPLLKYASRLIVLKLPGWWESQGVWEEIRTAKGKPIEYMEPV